MDALSISFLALVVVAFSAFAISLWANSRKTRDWE
jgi:hypothetical protein